MNTLRVAATRESVGARQLRHNTADIISAAEAGQEFHVTRSMRLIVSAGD